MTMTPDRFQQLLDQSTSAAPPAPLVSTDLEAGRTRLRRRRTVLASTVAATVVVVAGAVGVGWNLGADDRSVDPIAPTVPPAPSEAEVDRYVAECQDDMPTNLLGGPVRVMATAATAFEVQATFATEEGRFWATCSMDLTNRDEPPYVSTYDADNTEGSAFFFSAGPGCAGSDPTTCGLWELGVTDRVDPAVAAVRIDLWDSSSATVETADGYYAFTTLRPLPDGVTFEAGDDGLETLVGTDAGHPRISRLTYLDSDGDPLAATALDGSGSGLAGKTVDGLPGTEQAYPSLNGSMP
jgi:hypothetical protein